MKECNPAGVGGWRGGEVSLRLQQRPALSLNFPSIFMSLSFVMLSINFYSWAHSFSTFISSLTLVPVQTMIDTAVAEQNSNHAHTLMNQPDANMWQTC